MRVERVNRCQAKENDVMGLDLAFKTFQRGPACAASPFLPSLTRSNHLTMSASKQQVLSDKGNDVKDIVVNNAKEAATIGTQAVVSGAYLYPIEVSALPLPVQLKRVTERRAHRASTTSADTQNSGSPSSARSSWACSPPSSSPPSCSSSPISPRSPCSPYPTARSPSSPPSLSCSASPPRSRSSWPRCSGWHPLSITPSTR